MISKINRSFFELARLGPGGVIHRMICNMDKCVDSFTCWGENVWLLPPRRLYRKCVVCWGTGRCHKAQTGRPADHTPGLCYLHHQGFWLEREGLGNSQNGPYSFRLRKTGNMGGPVWCYWTPAEFYCLGNLSPTGSPSVRQTMRHTVRLSTFTSLPPCCLSLVYLPGTCVQSPHFQDTFQVFSLGLSTWQGPKFKIVIYLGAYFVKRYLYLHEQGEKVWQSTACWHVVWEIMVLFTYLIF